jgi:hypothetical protein
MTILLGKKWETRRNRTAVLRGERKCTGRETILTGLVDTLEGMISVRAIRCRGAAFRSFERQTENVRRKLERGLSIDAIPHWTLNYNRRRVQTC